MGEEEEEEEDVGMVLPTAAPPPSTPPTTSPPSRLRTSPCVPRVACCVSAANNSNFTQSAVEAFQNFNWARGAMKRFGAWWVDIASRFSYDPTVVGYQVLAQPFLEITTCPPSLPGREPCTRPGHRLRLPLQRYAPSTTITSSSSPTPTPCPSPSLPPLLPPPIFLRRRRHHRTRTRW